MNNDLEADLRALKRKADELESKDYLPQDLVALVIAIFRLQLEERHTARALFEKGLTLAPEMGQKEQGAPLLGREHFPLDRDLAEHLAPLVLDAIQEHTPTLAPLVEDCRSGLADGRYSLENACRAVILGHLPPDLPAGASPDDSSPAASANAFSAWVARHPDSPLFLYFVAHCCVTPLAVETACFLASGLEDDPATTDEQAEPLPSKSWPHGVCPICGSLPLIGRFQGTEGVRLHTCSFCMHEYRVPRIGCPFCRESAPESEEYFASPDEPGFRINVCSACNNYIKLADFRELDRGFSPALDDLLSLTLDMYARQMGYTRATLSAWGF